MSKLLPEPPTAANIKIVWFEFSKHVWTGTDYVSTIKVDAKSDEGATRQLALAYWREDQYWGFLMPRGCAVLVPDRNVLYIYARSIDPELPGDAEKETEGRPEDLMQTESPALDQNGFPLSKAQQAYQHQEVKPIVDAPHQPEVAAPKRRGRPPKVKPAQVG